MTALNKQALLNTDKHVNQHRLSRLTMEVHSDELRIIASAVESYTDELIAALEAAEKRIAELEAREVKLPKLKMLSDYLAEVTEREREDILVGVKLEFHRVLAAAGIGVKGE